MWLYIIWGIILFFVILMLSKFRSMYSIYICPKCKHQFVLTPVKDFFYPQILYRKMTRCPKCKKIVAAGIIKNDEKIEQMEEKKENVTNKKNKMNSKSKTKTKTKTKSKTQE
ncbi:MAG: hypothetical protein WCR27_08980 [Eubacteriales bacterium]